MTSLPNKLTIEGNLDISFIKISELPEELYIGGDLYCYSTDKR